MMSLDNFSQPGFWTWRLYNVQVDKWHVVDDTDFHPGHYTFADGRLFCCLSHWSTHVSHIQIVVRNPLTKKKRKLPPLLDMGSRDCDVYIRILQLIMDRKTKEHKVYYVGSYWKIGGNMLTKTQVYDSHVNAWSEVESREGCIIRGYPWPCVYLYMYNCADGNLKQFYLEDIAPGLTMFYKGYALINDHLFVLHHENIS